MNASTLEIQHIDAHTHIQFDAFNEDRDEVIARARDAKIGIVIAGSRWNDSVRGVEIAEKNYEYGVFACVGLHPGHSYDSVYGPREDFDEAAYYDLAQKPCVRGIGECGLDYFKLEENVENIKRLQKEIFLKHIYLAKAVHKPLVIHCRDAYSDLHTLLFSYKDNLVRAPLMHFFAGSVDDARRFLDLGFYFTFGGVITFPPKKNMKSMYDEVIKFIPIDRILTETDAPDVAPVPYRGRRNEPLYILEVEKKIAELKNISEDECAQHMVLNAQTLFGI